MNTLATAYNACSGHGKYQSILALFTVPGRKHKWLRKIVYTVHSSKQNTSGYRKNKL